MIEIKERRQLLVMSDAVGVDLDDLVKAVLIFGRVVEARLGERHCV